ncbi:DUF4129 domain-containing protein [Flavobacterium macacae]|uniref:DUF4129 domain-containing protein n=1 Tax=Flavobacterium macacae TaxID=2488993 RepID=A0A3P3W3D7_9FLAO|nr:DUF4129 domain-containing protein [Flavobacterium macacae]RRJ89611.1 DUF4129 domain-containing protein [Flavobacterium macacae]
MNKYLYLLFLFLSLNSFGQDSLSYVPPTIDTTAVAVKFTEKDILIDSSSVKAKTFPKDFKEKYTDADFQYEKKIKEKNSWDRFLDWLAYWLSKIFSFSSEGSSVSFVEILLKVLAVGVILFVIYLIVKAIMNGEGRWVFGKSSDKRVINYDEIEKNLHLVDFEKLIKEATKSGENRLLIRYYYLWLLKKLAEKEIIDWDVEKTNSDYIYEIKSEKLRGEFTYLSYLYNYIWYGEFKLEEEMLAKAVKSFEKTIKSL